MKDSPFSLRLSSLEYAVAIMVAFGVTASILQPLSQFARASLSRSVDRINGPAQPGAKGSKKAATTAPERTQKARRQRATSPATVPAGGP
jgi:hypothetical protein